MGRADHLELGDWNASCSMCGRKRKASQLVLNWQGMYRCPEHSDTRHPQDFVRSVPENMSVPWAQPPSDVFTGDIACGNAGGPANALILTPTVTIFDVLPGMIFSFTATATNTTAATATVLGKTYTIQLDGAALVAGDITDDLTYALTLNDPYFVLSTWT